MLCESTSRFMSYDSGMTESNEKKIQAIFPGLEEPLNIDTSSVTWHRGRTTRCEGVWTSAETWDRSAFQSTCKVERGPLQIIHSSFICSNKGPCLPLLPSLHPRPHTPPYWALGPRVYLGPWNRFFKAEMWC